MKAQICPSKTLKSNWKGRYEGASNLVTQPNSSEVKIEVRTGGQVERKDPSYTLSQITLKGQQCVL